MKNTSHQDSSAVSGLGGFSRRTMLGSVAASGVVATTAPLLQYFSIANDHDGSGETSDQWLSSTCQGCTSWCPVQVRVVDGHAVSIRGNPHSKATGGEICPRPHLALQQVYDPDRIKTPMIRTNPKKGRNEDPRFIPITWDEAMDRIADEMIQLRATEETHKFAMLRGRYSFLSNLFFAALPAIYGSPNRISHAAICAEAERFGAFFTQGIWDYHDYDLENTRYVLCWGTDPLSSNRQVPHAIRIWKHVRDHATIAVVDPRLSSTAAKANEWLPVIPGEDSALAVAMAHVILAEGLWSRDFVGDFQDGQNAFRVGEQVDASTFTEARTNGVVAWWNIELKDRTPEWAAERTGIPADQIRRVAIGFAKAAPRAISWLSPGAAMQPRGAYAAMAAHALNGLVGSTDHLGGPVLMNPIPTDDIPSLADYQDDLAREHAQYPVIDQRGTMAFPAMNSGKSGGGDVTNNVADAILNEDPYDLKIVIALWANFAFSCSGSERWERALSKLPFFVHVTTHASEMTHFADIVLPSGHQLFEKWSFLKNKANLHSFASLTKQLIKPMWDVRQDETDIPWMLAEKLAERGFDSLLRFYQEQFKDPETAETAVDAESFTACALKQMTRACWDASDPRYGKFGDQLDGWQDFVSKGVWNSTRLVPGQLQRSFPTASGKFEFYSETLKASLNSHAEKHGTTIDQLLETINYTARGEQAFVPHFEPAFRWGDEQNYPFIFFEHRSRLNREGRSANCSWYQQHKNADPGDENWDDVLKINPVDASKLGLSTGQLVKVSSTTGHLIVSVKLWEGVRPGTVAKCFGQGHWAYGRVASVDFQKGIPRGGNNNVLLPPDYERLSGATARHGGVARVRIEKV